MGQVRPRRLVADLHVCRLAQEGHVRYVVNLASIVTRLQPVPSGIRQPVFVAHHEVEGEYVMNLHVRRVDLIQQCFSFFSPVRSLFFSHENIHQQ